MEAVIENVTSTKYQTYKFSGEDWIGEIPDHWKVVKLKHLLFERKKRTNPTLNCGSISFGQVVTKDDEKIPLSTKASYQELKVGEFLVNPLNLNYDLISLRIALSRLNVVVSSGYIVLDAKVDVEKEYLKYLLHRYDVAYMKLLGSGVRQTISFNDIADSLLILPPLEEQTRIAEFLDRKTAQIDKAIAQKEKLIELLEEKKQSIIDQLVFRGEGDVSLKLSGVRWLGKIPVHWEVVRSKALFQERKERARVSDEQLTASQKHGVIPQKDFMEMEGRRVTQVEFNREILKHVEKGDFVISMRSFQGGLEFCDYRGCVSSAYVPLIPVKSVVPEFFKYFFKTRRYIEALSSTSNLVRDGQALRFQNFSQVDLLIIPEEEQREIARKIEGVTNQIDSILPIIELQIEKLKEYKATLINSAVTGKIRV